MEIEPRECPYCDEQMDQGKVTFPSAPGFQSTSQTGWFKGSARITAALACPACGYVELYVDPERLRAHRS